MTNEKRRRRALAALWCVFALTGCATTGGVPPSGPAACAGLTAARDAARTTAAYLDAQLSARVEVACAVAAPPVVVAAPAQ